jgi:single-stranded-DNA-specific exonuclease
MNIPKGRWQITPALEIPQWFIDEVQVYVTSSEVKYGAQLLWQRGIRELEQLPGFLNPDLYQPASPFAFGEEMDFALKRLQQAREFGEKVTIWGDFDADGITSTSVLWDGLGQFFPQYLQLDYYIPNRLSESHGLNSSGIARLAASGTKLIVTCDTGSTNLAEIESAQELGIDIIVTDHHTLPESRPQVTAIINPRYFDLAHPLYSLSGVAVAYKLVEALYQTLPNVPQQPLENLLDLVAIGLIADLVELKGDCRYLAQVGIRQLQKQVNPSTANRPGVSRLLELCRRNGDRPTDISFGLGPRINAVSRIHGDADFCVELLTSRDAQRCNQLAEETELANTRRKSLQKDVLKQVKQKLEQLDLSTTSVIVLEDSQWQGGVLGLVAGQIAQEYGRPTVLLSSGVESSVPGLKKAGLPKGYRFAYALDRLPQSESKDTEDRDYELLARGSARSVNNIDLYKLVKSQEDLLHRFGGHPFAAGLSLPLANLNLFREGINQQQRQQAGMTAMMPQIQADLVVSVADLGKELFNELRLLEPCGMGNPIPKLLIKNCWFKNVWNNNIHDSGGQKIQYIKTTFNIWDDSINKGFPGLWWGHYKDEIPLDIKCEAIAELDFNTYYKRYEIRLIAVRSMTESLLSDSTVSQTNLIIDRRLNPEELEPLESLEVSLSQLSIIDKCPLTWNEIRQQYQQAIKRDRALVLAYSPSDFVDAQTIWKQIIGIAKYLSRTKKPVTKLQLQEKLKVSDRILDLSLQALVKIGFTWDIIDNFYQFSWQENQLNSDCQQYLDFLFLAIKEEQFQQQYFYQVPLSTINRQLTTIV